MKQKVAVLLGASRQNFGFDSRVRRQTPRLNRQGAHPHASQAPALKLSLPEQAELQPAASKPAGFKRLTRRPLAVQA